MLAALAQQAAAPSVDPIWLTVLDRFGVPIVLLMFFCLIVWRLHPHVIEWFKAQTASANVVAAAVPVIQAALQTMATEERGTLLRIENKVDALHTKADATLAATAAR